MVTLVTLVTLVSLVSLVTLVTLVTGSVPYFSGEKVKLQVTLVTS